MLVDKEYLSAYAARPIGARRVGPRRLHNDIKQHKTEIAYNACRKEHAYSAYREEHLSAYNACRREHAYTAYLEDDVSANKTHVHNYFGWQKPVVFCDRTRSQGQ